LSVITFPPDLFYPIGVHTVGLFVKKGISHPQNQNVLWIRALSDGFAKSKGKRLPSTRALNDLERVKDLLKAFLINPYYPVESIPKFIKACPIDFEDSILELVAEVYLDDIPPTIEEINSGINQMIKETMVFFITRKISDKS
jgi:type I restriction enzyme M protein